MTDRPALVDQLVARWERPDPNAIHDLVALYPEAASRILQVMAHADDQLLSQDEHTLLQCEHLPFGYWLQEIYADIDTIGDSGDECLAMVERLVREPRRRDVY